MGHDGGKSTDSHYPGDSITTTYLPTDDEERSSESQSTLFIYGRTKRTKGPQNAEMLVTCHDRNIRFHRAGWKERNDRRGDT